MKLISKERIGGRIHRKYDTPRTPCQRLLESGQLSGRAEKQLRSTYESLNAAQLRREIEKLRDRLFALTEARAAPEPPPRRGKLMLSIGPQQRQRRWLAERAEGQ